MNNPVLSCEGLVKSYQDGTSKIEVLRGINLTVQPGETVAIIGHSGSGKSTLLHLLGGLDKPSAGRVLIKGQDFSHLSENEKCYMRNHHLGFVYQFHHLLPEFSALENVSMPLLIRGLHPEQARADAAELLTKVGLGNRLQHRLGQLSGGERQRTAIARALIAKPLCVLADEPTGNLDKQNAELVLHVFMELQKASKTSVIMVTHDLTIARQADRTLSLVEGQLVAL